MPSFAAVRCPRDTQAPTDQRRSFTSLHTTSIRIGRKKDIGQPAKRKHSSAKAAGSCGISWPPLSSQLVALTASSTVVLLIPGSSLTLRGDVPMPTQSLLTLQITVINNLVSTKG